MPRQNITVLFTDMVDSTAVATSMTPDAADELRRRHFALLRQAIGTTEGLEVKNLGDGVMVAFHSASAALSCAVQMQQAIEIDNRARTMSIGLRVGLSGGEVSYEDGDYFGDPVIEAARVCAKCESGQILVADVVRLMAGRHGGHVYESVGEVMLKGLPHAVTLIKVAWVRDLGATAIELPQRIALLPTDGFVGRASELAMIEQHGIAVAASSKCEVLLVVGEPGQGKTTLATAAARRAHEHGAFVLFGRTDEHLGSPYKLFSEPLGHFITHASDDLLRAAIGPQASDLVRLVPALIARLADVIPSSGSDTDSELFLMFAAVVSTFVELSKLQPILLVLDDLQWADQSSLRLLAHVATSAQPMRLLIIATCRDDELPPSHPLVETLAALHRHERISRLDLGGLSRDEVMALMGATDRFVGFDADSFADDIHRDTDGNAFFVTELLRHVSDNGAFGQTGVDSLRSKMAMSPGVLPKSVQEVIATRVGKLGADDERVLRNAAVIGREFDLDTLERLTETSDTMLLDVMDRAVAVGLVREFGDVPGRFRFQHALIQRTIYDGLGSSRRASMHRQVALAIEAARVAERDRRLVELARHWSLTGRVSDLGRAVDYARRSAEAALAGLAPDVALRHYSDAIGWRVRLDEPNVDVDLDLTIGLGIAQRKVGLAEYRDTLLGACQVAAKIGDARRLVHAALNNSRGWSSAVGVIDSDRVSVLETALADLPRRSTDRALILAALCKELSWGTPLGRREELAEEAAAIAVACDDDAAAVRVLNDLALPLSTPHTLATSLQRTAVALERAERLGDPLLLFFASLWRGQTLLLAGDTDGRNALTERSSGMAERLGEPTLLWSRMHNTAMRAMCEGDVETADGITTAAFEFGIKIGEPDAATYFGVQQMVVCLQRGNMGELTPLIEDTLVSMPELGDAGRAALMMSHLEGGRTDEAVAMLDASAAVNFGFGLDNSWIVVTVDHAEVAVEQQLVEHAGRLREMLLPFAGLIACTGLTSQGPVALYLGGLASVLSLYDEADRFFEQADATNRRTGDRFSAARTALWWGRLAAQRDQIELARGRLALARLIAGEHGYAMVARRAADSFAALG